MEPCVSIPFNIKLNSAIISIQLSHSFNMLNIDYSAWKFPRYLYQIGYQPERKELTRNGLHSFIVSREFSELTLDFLASGFPQDFEEGGALLIGFNGALSAKTIAKGALPPYFSGIGLTKATGLPLFGVADPTMALDRSITMAWYAGNKYIPDLVPEIARILDAVIYELAARAILLGGSAGGFAALNIFRHMKTSNASVICWNPQTSLAEYQINSVRKYLTVAYGSSDNFDNRVRNRKDFKQYLEENFDFVPYAIPKPEDFTPDKKIIYLQNFSDTLHTISHAAKWLNGEEFSHKDESVYFNKRENILFYLGEWGNGHVAPPLDGLIEIIKSVDKCVSFDCIYSKFLRLYNGSFQRDLSWLPGLNFTKNSIDWTVVRNGDRLNIAVTPKEGIGPMDHFEYAFYLRRGREVIAKSLYQQRPAAEFSVEGMPTTGLSASVFLKDRLGAIRSASCVISPRLG